MAVEAVTFYLVAYMATSLASFGVVSVLSESHRDADSLEDYRGLYWRKPWLAAVMTVSLMSLAGIPLTAGFVGKFYVLTAGMEVGLYALIVLLVLNSAIGIFYYLRIVLAMLWAPEHEHAPAPGATSLAGAGGGAALAAAPWVPFAAAVVLGVAMLALLWIGVQPGPLQNAVEAAVTGLR
jgi:NADH-quinone oxidoreductase subunit N